LRYQLIVMALALISVFALKVLLVHPFGAAGVLAAAPIGWVLVVWPAFIWLSMRLISGRQPLGGVPAR
jgi:hypothetical protein